MCHSDNKSVQYDYLNHHVPPFTNCGIDPLKDTCEYISCTDLDTLKSDKNDFLVLQLNVRDLISKQQSLTPTN